ncbi:ABC-2 family transporter protein [Longispora sp. K20-0274]|uniref:ABC transporter permease n=1 Tax=Longispora sp. K20-0274 TaxID=3088255 RepID=UPI00399A60F2
MAFTNSVFGFLKCYVFLTVAAGAGGAVLGYDRSQLATYMWVSQGIIGVINVWGQPDLVQQIRTGNVVSDLLRPVDLMWGAAATESGRFLYSMLIRFSFPVVVGALFFTLYLPRHPWTYALFAVALVLSAALCFCLRYLVALVCFWLLDIRGVWTAWVLMSGLFGGLQFPVELWPDRVAAVLHLTPFPLLFQGPLDVIVEKRSWQVIGLQLGWLAVLFGVCRLVQARALRKLVVQGG